MTCFRQRWIAALALGLMSSTAWAESGGRVALDTVGYLCQAPKKATLVGAGDSFTVIRQSDGAAVLEAKASAPRVNNDTGEQVRIADFSEVTTPGEYRLVAAGVAKPVPFRVGDDVYREPFRLVTRGMYLWRCGTAVAAEHEGLQFQHDACHLEDALLDFVGGQQRRPSVGGWHDAGDYNKYVVNAGATVGVMFRAWEDFGDKIKQVELDLPEAGGPLPEFLAELKWELDWLLTMQADDGRVWHKVSTIEFGPFQLPEEEQTPRYFAPWSSAATADFVAMMAMAARYYQPHDPDYAARCLQAAQKSCAYLREHPEDHPADLRDFKTGGYNSPDWDDRLWAEAEMWETTGEPQYLEALEARLSNATQNPARSRGHRRSAGFDADWDWNNLKNLGLLTYLFSKREGRDAALVADLRASLMGTADGIAEAAAEHGYARPLGTRYYWGCNGTVARQSMVLHAAYRLTGRETYREVALDGVHHLFGRNVFGRSFVTGLGAHPPLHPHDRRSGGDDVAPPWPGYLVGGPHPRAVDWHDDQEDYRTNEIAINWNAALIYALGVGLGEYPPR